MDYDNLSQQVRHDPAVHTGKGATAEEIAQAEARLAVSFPESYRRFLSDFGWASVGGDELYGLGEDVPRHLHLVGNTEGERTQFRPHIRAELIPLMNDGTGNHYCLDTTRLAGGRCPVVFWDHEHELAEEQNPVDEADDFIAWAAERLAGAQEDRD